MHEDTLVPALLDVHGEIKGENERRQLTSWKVRGNAGKQLESMKRYIETIDLIHVLLFEVN